MSKTIPMIVEVEDIAVGKFLRLLEKTPGIAKYAFDLRDKKETKPNGAGEPRTPRGHFDVPGEQAILAILKGRPPQTSTMLSEAFAAQGRSPHSISSCIHKLKTDGLLTSTSEGYTLTKKARDRLRHQKKSKGR